METIVRTIKDDKINRDHSYREYVEMADEFVLSEFGVKREHGGGDMSWNEFSIKYYYSRDYRFKISVKFDFNTNTAILTKEQVY